MLTFWKVKRIEIWPFQFSLLEYMVQFCLHTNVMKVIIKTGGLSS